MINSQLHPTFNGSDLRNYFDSPAQVADYFGIPERTARDWYRKNQAPNSAKRLMDIAASRFLPCSLGWEDLRIFNGLLYTPSGQVITPAQLDYICKCFDTPRHAQRWLQSHRHEARIPLWVKEQQSSKVVELISVPLKL
ncbi:hypothetical protein [Agarivorans litoreus]|uniref:hypothetical protein n=1 Tax=Agarivorans litoreus TaxID=1510455 RepID=UPI001C7DAE00|nr:hypothetical protein [Agarivorans litoreus]